MVIDIFDLLNLEIVAENILISVGEIQCISASSFYETGVNSGDFRIIPVCIFGECVRPELPIKIRHRSVCILSY